MKHPSTLLLAALVGGLAVYALGRKPSPPVPAAASLPAKAAPAAPEDSPHSPERSDTTQGLRNPSAGRLQELESFAAGLKDKVVVNYGTVSEVGENTSLMMTTRGELRGLKKIPGAQRTPEQNRRIQELERIKATTLGMLPEVASFQNQPDQYGQFYSSLLKTAAGLDAAQTARVQDYMTQRGEQMVAQGFNAAKEPADPAAADAWEVRRDAFNQETARGAAALLPTGAAESIGFTPGFLELMEQDFDKAD